MIYPFWKWLLKEGKYLPKLGSRVTKTLVAEVAETNDEEVNRETTEWVIETL